MHPQHSEFSQNREADQPVIAVNRTHMSAAIIEINRLSKRYHLGRIGMSSFREESENLFRRFRGQSEGKVIESAAREFWALRDVSFTVKRGEVVGIIGKNGAGKSTLLKILSRITDPTSGEAVLRGRVASLLEVGTGFHPELSGRENIFLNGAILGMKRTEISTKFDEIVDFAEVGQFIDTPVKRYSSGMFVRLAFAVAAHLEPEILIVDEVLAVGDVAFQKKCVTKMNEVSGHGRTVLFVSHNVGLIRELCSRAVLLEGGRVTIDGEVGRTIEAYNRSAGATEEFHRTTSAGTPTGSQPRLQAVRIMNENGGSILHIDGGYHITIKADHGLPYLGALVRIRDQSGQVVQYFNTAFKGDSDMASSETPSSFTLKVGQANLPPGGYTLDAELWLPEGKTDGVEGACRFEITDGYFQGRQARHYSGRCATLTPHQWDSH